MVRYLFILGLILLPVLYSCDEEPCDELYPTEVELMFYDHDLKNVNFELTRLEGIGIGRNISTGNGSTTKVELKLHSGLTSFQFQRNGNWDTLHIASTVVGIYHGERCGYTQRSEIDSFEISSGIDSVQSSFDFYDYHPVKVFLK